MFSISDDLFTTICKIRDTADYTLHDETNETWDRGVIEHSQNTINSIIMLLESGLSDELKKQKLTVFLESRWRYLTYYTYNPCIGMHYTHNPNLPLHQVFLLIAQACANANESILKTLMPTIESIIAGASMGTLKEDEECGKEDGKIILDNYYISHDPQNLISLTGVAEYAAGDTDFLHGAKPRFADITPQDKFHLANTCTPEAKTFFNALEQQNKAKEKPTLGKELVLLRDALVASSVTGRGTAELAESGDCEEAILHFQRIWISLSVGEKNKVRNLRLINDHTNWTLEIYLLILFYHNNEGSLKLLSEEEVAKVRQVMIRPQVNTAGVQVAFTYCTNEISKTLGLFIQSYFDVLYSISLAIDDKDALKITPKEELTELKNKFIESLSKRRLKIGVKNLRFTLGYLNKLSDLFKYATILESALDFEQSCLENKLELEIVLTSYSHLVDFLHFLQPSNKIMFLNFYIKNNTTKSQIFQQGSGFILGNFVSILKAYSSEGRGDLINLHRTNGKPLWADPNYLLTLLDFFDCHDRVQLLQDFKPELHFLLDNLNSFLSKRFILFIRKFNKEDHLKIKVLYASKINGLHKANRGRAEQYFFDDTSPAEQSHLIQLFMTNSVNSLIPIQNDVFWLLHEVSNEIFNEVLNHFQEFLTSPYVEESVVDFFNDLTPEKKMILLKNSHLNIGFYVNFFRNLSFLEELNSIHENYPNESLNFPFIFSLQFSQEYHLFYEGLDNCASEKKVAFLLTGLARFKANHLEISGKPFLDLLVLLTDLQRKEFALYYQERDEKTLLYILSLIQLPEKDRSIDCRPFLLSIFKDMLFRTAEKIGVFERISKIIPPMYLQGFLKRFPDIFEEIIIHSLSYEKEDYKTLFFILTLLKDIQYFDFLMKYKNELFSTERKSKVFLKIIQTISITNFGKFVKTCPEILAEITSDALLQEEETRNSCLWAIFIRLEDVDKFNFLVQHKDIFPPNFFISVFNALSSSMLEKFLQSYPEIVSQVIDSTENFIDTLDQLSKTATFVRHTATYLKPKLNSIGKKPHHKITEYLLLYFFPVQFAQAYPDSLIILKTIESMIPNPDINMPILLCAPELEGTWNYSLKNDENFKNFWSNSCSLRISLYIIFTLENPEFIFTLLAAIGNEINAEANNKEKDQLLTRLGEVLSQLFEKKPEKFQLPFLGDSLPEFFMRNPYQLVEKLNANVRLQFLQNINCTEMESQLTSSTLLIFLHQMPKNDKKNLPLLFQCLKKYNRLLDIVNTLKDSEKKNILQSFKENSLERSILTLGGEKGLEALREFGINSLIFFMKDLEEIDALILILKAISKPSVQLVFFFLLGPILLTTENPTVHFLQLLRAIKKDNLSIFIENMGGFLFATIEALDHFSPSRGQENAFVRYKILQMIKGIIPPAEKNSYLLQLLSDPTWADHFDHLFSLEPPVDDFLAIGMHIIFKFPDLTAETIPVFLTAIESFYGFPAVGRAISKILIERPAAISLLQVRAALETSISSLYKNITDFIQAVEPTYRLKVLQDLEINRKYSEKSTISSLFFLIPQCDQESFYALFPSLNDDKEVLSCAHVLDDSERKTISDYFKGARKNPKEKFRKITVLISILNLIHYSKQPIFFPLLNRLLFPIGIPLAPSDSNVFPLQQYQDFLCLLQVVKQENLTDFITHIQDSLKLIIERLNKNSSDGMLNRIKNMVPNPKIDIPNLLSNKTLLHHFNQVLSFHNPENPAHFIAIGKYIIFNLNQQALEPFFTALQTCYGFADKSNEEVQAQTISALLIENPVGFTLPSLAPFLKPFLPSIEDLPNFTRMIHPEVRLKFLQNIQTSILNEVIKTRIMLSLLFMLPESHQENFHSIFSELKKYAELMALIETLEDFEKERILQLFKKDFLSTRKSTDSFMKSFEKLKSNRIIFFMAGHTRINRLFLILEDRSITSATQAKFMPILSELLAENPNLPKDLTRLLKAMKKENLANFIEHMQVLISYNIRNFGQLIETLNQLDADSQLIFIKESSKYLRYIHYSPEHKIVLMKYIDHSSLLCKEALLTCFQERLSEQLPETYRLLLIAKNDSFGKIKSILLKCLPTLCLDKFFILLKEAQECSMEFLIAVSDIIRPLLTRDNFIGFFQAFPLNARQNLVDHLSITFIVELYTPNSLNGITSAQEEFEVMRENLNNRYLENQLTKIAKEMKLFDAARHLNQLISSIEDNNNAPTPTLCATIRVMEQIQNYEKPLISILKNLDTKNKKIFFDAIFRENLSLIKFIQEDESLSDIIQACPEERKEFFIDQIKNLLKTPKQFQALLKIFDPEKYMNLLLLLRIHPKSAIVGEMNGELEARAMQLYAKYSEKLPTNWHDLEMKSKENLLYNLAEKELSDYSKVRLGNIFNKNSMYAPYSTFINQLLSLTKESRNILFLINSIISNCPDYHKNPELNDIVTFFNWCNGHLTEELLAKKEQQPDSLIKTYNT